jgi:preprotein translocase subunit SecE
VATARGNRTEDPPNPIEHATPDVELAEAQLALGRSEDADEERPTGSAFDDTPPDEDPADSDADNADPGGAQPAGEGGGGDYDEDDDEFGPEDSGSGGRRRGASTAVSAPRGHPGSRLVQFLAGSWRELQRVQWPDRRQVMQATGVVIGFVIVAGAFLGVADLVATKVVKLILP